MKWKWKQIDERNNIVRCGVAEAEEVVQWCKDRRAEALDYLNSHPNVRHCIYAAKIYQSPFSDNVKEIRFYDLALSEDEFYSNKELFRDDRIVYAVHRRE